MDASDCLQRCAALRVEVGRLLELAKAEDWDAFTEALPVYDAAMTALPEVPWATLSPTQQRELAEVLAGLKTEQEELFGIALARREALAGELQSLHNAGRLGKAYR